MRYSRLTSISCISILFVNSLQAQTPQKLNIDAATIFLSGAELISSAKVNLSKGENELIFTNVAGDVNSQSLSVSCTNGVVVESATFQNNYLATEVFSPKVKEIKDSIELIVATKAQVNNKIATLAEQIAILQGNRKVSGENTGLSVAELTKMLDLIGTRMENILNQKNKEEAVLSKLNERQAKLNKQLDEEQKKGFQPGGQLLVKFYSPEATTTAVTIDYVVPHAGWTPTYDVWADGASGPIKLYYKANIFQNSGVKWNNVRLSLSTGNPNEGAQAPTLNPWFLAFYVPIQNYNNNMAQAPAAVYQSNKGGALSFGGGRSGGTKYLIDNGDSVADYQTGINNYVTVDNSGINTSFDIDLPYTIPSDGQQHLVAIKRFELPATYRYFAVPKLDKDAFLQAQVTNWEDLNLLPGTSNIFYEGTYVGQGTIDVRNVKDTMTLSLGRDKKIVVKRERDTKRRSVKTIGTNVRETFAYTISVRNTRKEPINLIIQDQLPVSNDKDIVIEDVEKENAESEETTGMLKWTLTLNSNETKKEQFGFTVKYPKGKTVQLPR